MRSGVGEFYSVRPAHQAGTLNVVPARPGKLDKSAYAGGSEFSLTTSGNASDQSLALR